MTTNTNTVVPIHSVTKETQSDQAALKEPHPTPAHWLETYSAIKEMRLWFPAPVDMMGCNMAKWKEMHSWVRDAYH